MIDSVCVDCGKAIVQSSEHAWSAKDWLCEECLVKRATKMFDIEAERDYAIDRWLRLENEYEPFRRKKNEPWTREELLQETRFALLTKKE